MLEYIWLLLWIIGPDADKPNDPGGPTMSGWIVHTAIFMAYAIAVFLATLGSYLEVLEGPDAHKVTRAHRLFMAVYATSVGYVVFVYLYDLYNYRYGLPPAIPPVLTQVANLFWLGCISFITPFMPDEYYYYYYYYYYNYYYYCYDYYYY